MELLTIDREELESLLNVTATSLSQMEAFERQLEESKDVLSKSWDAMNAVGATVQFLIANGRMPTRDEQRDDAFFDDFNMFRAEYHGPDDMPEYGPFDDASEDDEIA